jgi:hypothetical protein
VSAIECKIIICAKELLAAIESALLVINDLEENPEVAKDMIQVMEKSAKEAKKVLLELTSNA